jgi:hypothetical protein
MPSYDFALTRNQIIESALEAIGVLGMGQNPSYEQTSRASRELNALLKNMDFGNSLAWRTEDTTITLTSGNASYTATAGLVGIQRPVLRINNQDTGLTLLSFNDYFSGIPDKTTSGRPTHITFKEGTTSNTIYVWPVPTETLTVRALGVYEISDMDSASDANLFPKQWSQIIVWKLAAVLCYHYGVDPNTKAQIEGKAEELYQKGRIDNFITKIGAEVYFEPY